MNKTRRRPAPPVREVATRGALIALAVLLIAGCRDRATPVEPPLDLSGTWTLTVESVCQGPLTITQTGNTFGVTGSIGGSVCPFSASGFGDGLLEGRTIRFGIGFGTGADQSGAGLGSVTFDGNVDANGNRMSGTYAGNRSGTWQAVRN